jgi:hypothetical protein
MTRSTTRFRTLVGLACASALLLLVTLVWRDWIEIAFRVDPDKESGRAEWLVVAVLGATTAVFSLAAKLERRHMQRASAGIGAANLS